MKNRLWVVLFLLIIWCGFSNNFQPVNILLGLFFSLAIHFLVMSKPLDFKINSLQLIILCFYMIWKLLQSSLEVAWDILTPKAKSQPKLIRLTLNCKHPVQISLLSNLISLTPGTLTIDIEKENEVLILHVMFAQNQKKIIAFIRGKLEPRIMKVIEHG